MEATLTTSSTAPEGRVLVVADWKADPHAVVAACACRAEAQHVSFTLVVPAALHGIDWVGDPYANIPCAWRALEKLIKLLPAAGLELASATVGDHDPVAAAIDATFSQPVEQIVVCGLKRRIKAFDLGHRVSRATELPVLSVPVPSANRGRRAWLRLVRGECGTAERIGRAPGPVMAS
jgi:hypothetical protein